MNDGHGLSLRYPSGVRMLKALSRKVAVLTLLLTLGAGQLWADNGDFYNMYIAYSFEGAAGSLEGADNNTGASADLGTLTTGSLTLTGVYLKCWDDWGVNFKSSGGLLGYTNKGGSEQELLGFSRSGKNGNNYEWQNASPGLTIASYDQASGSFAFECWGKTYGNNWGDRFFPKSSGHYVLNYKIAPPAVSSFSVSTTGSNILSGSGTSENPYIIAYNGSLVLSLSGSQAHTDANSSAQYNTSGTWNTTTSRTISSITSTTKKSVTVKMRYYNSTASLGGTESSSTIYYQSEESYNVTAASGGNGTATPTSATAMGTTSGGNITASPSTGYNFGSWAITSGSGYFGESGTATTSTTANTKFRPSAATTVTATFTAKTTTVTLNGNAPGGQTVTGGGTEVTATYDAALPSFSALTCTGGYALKGYYDASSAGNKIINADGSFNANSGIWNRTDGATLTLYAQWSLDRTLTYDGNGNTGGSVPAAATNYSNGASVTVLGNTNSLVKTGYTFNGWNTQADGNGTDYAASSSITMNANYTLYAQWSENDYTVTVMAGSNGSVASGSVTGHKDTKVTLPTATANTGYHFDTWTTTTGSVTYTNQTSATTAQVNGLTAAATVQATFAANTYEVAFNNNGGSGSMSNESFTYDASAKALTTNTFTKSGYTFIGWATSSSRAAALTVDYTDGQSVRNLTSAHNGTYTLYAVWVQDYYLGGRVNESWDDDSKTHQFTYVSDGQYKWESSMTVAALSGTYDSYPQYFFVHTGSGTSGTYYTSSSSNGHSFQTNFSSNKLTLATGTNTNEDKLIKFSNVDNLSSNVIIWWKPSTKEIWYEATENLNTNYYLLGFGSGNWSTTDARRFKVASVNATTATVSLSLTATTYSGTNDGFKLYYDTWYGNNGTMTRGNCSGWVFETSLGNCAITADVAGTYTFTLNLSTKAVSVTYPSETLYTVTVAAGAGGSVSTASLTNVGVSTRSAEVTATPNAGYVFTEWTLPAGTSAADGYTAASNPIKINATAASKTITANFAAATAYIEGRFHVTNASRDGSWTNTFSAGNWDESSTAIKFTWDGTNSRYYLHTYATPAELTSQISSQDPFFYIKTSSSSSSLADVVSYWSATAQTLSAAGTGNKRTLAHTGDVINNNLKFNSEDNSGYAILYFDEAGIWYELEQTLKYDGNGSDGGSAPAGTVYYDKGATATAAANSYTRTGYVFAGWNTQEDGNGTSYAAGASVTMNSNITLYAQWNETTYAVTFNNGDHGTVSPSGSQQVGAGGVSVTATPAAGWKFVNWTKTGNDVTLSSTTTNPTTVTAAGTGSVTPTYAHRYVLRGSTLANDATTAGMAGWEADDNSDYASATIADGIMTITANLTAANTEYKFMIRDTKDNVYKGQTGSGSMTDGEDWTLNGTNDVKFTTTVAGIYTFTYNTSSGSMVITYPTTYTLTYSIGTVAGTDGTIICATASGGYMASGNTVTLTGPAAKTGYTWSGWYTNAAGTEGKIADTNRAITVTMNANKTLYACYTENEYNVTVSAGANGSVSPTGTVAIKQVNGTTLTATPSTNYVFKDWTISGGGIALKTPSTSTSNPATLTATGTGGTITANFFNKWVLAGGDDAGNADDGDELGDWDTWTNGFDHFGTNASSKDTCYLELTLPANTRFKFKVLDHASGNWYGNSTSGVYYMNYASNNKQFWDGHVDGGGNNYQEFGLETAGAGTYKFVWNVTDKSVCVHFPTSYTVTFGQGTGNGTAVTASGSVSGSITNGQYVAAGENVTFTQTPATGYTFTGWYNASSGGTAVSGMGTSDHVLDAIAANASVYAQYTEDIYTVTVTASEHGTITTPAGGSGSTVSVGVVTSAPIVAAPEGYGYYFSRWTVESGSATFGSATSPSTTVNATSDATIKANFVSHWTIAGGDSEVEDDADAMGNWNQYANGIDHFDNASGDYIGYVDIDLPANTTFYFKVRNLYNGSAWYGNSGVMTFGDHTNWPMASETSNCRITTAGAGTYRFTWNENQYKLTITYPESYTVTYDTRKSLGNEESISSSTSAGSISSVTDAAGAFTSGNYVVNGGTVTFTHSAAETDYHFAGWYSDAACTTAYVNGEGGAVINDGAGTLTLTVSGTTTVYAKFAENMTTVTLAHTGNGHIEMGGATVTDATAGSETTRTITAVPDAGWYFAGWTLSDGADCTVASTAGRDDNESSSTTLTGSGAGTTGTVTANFVENDKVYFRNWNDEADAPLWENVYVYFDVVWDDSHNPSYGVWYDNPKVREQMTQIGETNVYWAYVPRAYTAGSKVKIAFANYACGWGNNFYQNEAVYREDYRHATCMFVPRHSDTETFNGTTYYKGYWKHYGLEAGSDAGYRIERYTGSTYVQPADNGGDRIKFIVVDENTIEYLLRVDNTSEGYNNYMIYSYAGVHYNTFNTTPALTGYTVTTANHSDIGLTEYTSGSPRFYITPTSEGIYKLVIDMSGDVMRLSVTYPVAVGDYMLVHTYNDGSAKASRSDVIKPEEVSSRLYSMYIDNITAHTKSLKLKKCTALTAGVPTWSAGTDVSMTGFKADTAAVFQFNVAIAADNATLSDIEFYAGDYYIKTDCAPGGWTAYTSNMMEKNHTTFDTKNAKTYDYYYCKWVNDANTNVKCVIANDYCNAVSDTLIGDDILGTYMEDEVEKPRQTLPYAANVRFSYNSYTNSLKRAYINGATDWQQSFLLLKGDSKIKNLNGTPFPGDSVTFTDKNNWIYQLDLKAQENARIKLTANYRYNSEDHIQYFIGSKGYFDVAHTEQIIGGTDPDTTWFPMRLIYDFKTNKLIAAYLPQDGSVDADQQIEADIMFIRNHHESAGQITFGGDFKLTDVHTAYGVMEFDKTTIFDNTKSQAERSLYWISFPFDVKAKEIFGMGEYGTHWILEYYDGAARAAEGQWVDSPTRWKYVMPEDRDTFVLRKGFGYVLGLSLNRMKEDALWVNSVTSVHLYFPSASAIGDITGTLTSVNIPAHTCNITRNNRNIWDSDWNVIGVPSYWNINAFTGPASPETQPGNSARVSSPGNVGFYYKWNATTNDYKIAANDEETDFQTMYAYLVQFAGIINWQEKRTGSVAARRIASEEEKEQYTLDLHLTRNGATADHAYIRFSDNATEAYDMNSDLVKNANGTQALVYTLLERAYMPDPSSDIPVRMGANCLPVPAAEKTVAVGVQVSAAGEYTFTMPDGTDGMEVTLIDYLLNREVPLALGDYTVELEKGAVNDRFALRINRKNIVTAIEGCDDAAMQTSAADKVIINSNLFIRSNGHVYDAQGKRVR